MNEGTPTHSRRTTIGTLAVGRVQASLQRSPRVTRASDERTCEPDDEQNEPEAYLDEIFSLVSRHQGLELRRCERVDEPRLGHDEQQYLRARQRRQLKRLQKCDDRSAAAAMGEASVVGPTFFMIPAFRFEKVMCLLALSSMYEIWILRRALAAPDAVRAFLPPPSAVGNAARVGG